MASRVAVIGLGRVGLPFALFLAQHGHTVHGIDSNPDTVGALRDGPHAVSRGGRPGGADRDARQRASSPAPTSRALREVETIIITLGTPVDEFNNPVFLPIEHLLRAALPHLQAGQLLVLRSTVAPGATEHLGRLIERTTVVQDRPRPLPRRLPGAHRRGQVVRRAARGAADRRRRRRRRAASGRRRSSAR